MLFIEDENIAEKPRELPAFLNVFIEKKVAD